MFRCKLDYYMKLLRNNARKMKILYTCSYLSLAFFAIWNHDIVNLSGCFFLQFTSGDHDFEHLFNGMHFNTREVVLVMTSSRAQGNAVSSIHQYIIVSNEAVFFRRSEAWQTFQMSDCIALEVESGTYRWLMRSFVVTSQRMLMRLYLLAAIEKFGIVFNCMSVCLYVNKPKCDSGGMSYGAPAMSLTW